MHVLPAAWRASLPVMFGYVPLGMAFGILFQDLGYPWYLATLMGLLVYAGAAQFMAVGLLAAHAGLIEIAVSTFALNLRHVFFGLSMLDRYRCSGLKKLYLIFGLTDETYSLATSATPPVAGDPSDYYFAITALNQSYWVVGCTLGAITGSAVEFDSTGMEFALTALFLVLLLEQWKAVRTVFPFLVAASCGLIALIYFKTQMLLVSISLSLILLVLRYRYSGNS
ncbi:MAG: AzlC family ABC transporter permease [Gammaproteobacteria bacterium]|nr:AzlC family ABC transporter permease [Gammaproteobacteria bacterium]